MCSGSVWQTCKVRRVRPRRSCKVVTAKARRTNTDAVHHQQVVETMRLLWLAIGRDPDLQERVIQHLEEVRKEVGYAPDSPPGRT